MDIKKRKFVQKLRSYDFCKALCVKLLMFYFSRVSLGAQLLRNKLFEKYSPRIDTSIFCCCITVAFLIGVI